MRQQNPYKNRQNRIALKFAEFTSLWQIFLLLESGAETKESLPFFVIPKQYFCGYETAGR